MCEKFERCERCERWFRPSFVRGVWYNGGMKELLFCFVDKWGGVIGFAVGVIALFRFAASLIRSASGKVKAYKADMSWLDGRIESAAVDGDLLIVSGFVENKRRRTVFVDNAAFYDPQAVGISKLMSGELVQESLHHGARAPFTAVAFAADKGLAYCQRLEVRVFGERGKLLLKLPVDPEQVRVAFEKADVSDVFRFEPLGVQRPFASRPTPAKYRQNCIDRKHKNQK